MAIPGLDSRLRKISQNLITKFGQAHSIGTIVNGGYNPVTGEFTQTSVTTSIPVVFESYRANEVQGSVQAGDKKAYIASADIATIPTVQDRLLADGINHDIISVETIRSGTLDCVYVLQLRTA